MAMKKRGVLGSGMSSLFSSNEIEEKHSGGVLEVDINKITPNPKQPRNKFDDATLMELADSIKEVGVLQPITVKKNGDYYVIIAGERRWRAARIAGLEKIPAIEKDLDELKILEAALIENVQREDLNPMEEAYTYKRLSEEYSLSQEQIAKKVGKSRTVVANAIRLLNLDERVQTFIKENRISNGHGRALIPLDKEQQFELAERIIDEGLSVSQIEELVKEMNPDVCIVATGATPLVLPIPGINDVGVINAIDLLDGQKACGTKVLVVGGGMVGAETAEFLAEQEHEVSIIEFKDKIAGDVAKEHRKYIMEAFDRHNVESITGAKVAEFYTDGVKYELADGSVHEVRGFDSVVLAMGSRNYDPISE